MFIWSRLKTQAKYIKFSLPPLTAHHVVLSYWEPAMKKLWMTWWRHLIYKPKICQISYFLRWAATENIDKQETQSQEFVLSASHKCIQNPNELGRINCMSEKTGCGWMLDTIYIGCKLVSCLLERVLFEVVGCEVYKSDVACQENACIDLQWLAANAGWHGRMTTFTFTGVAKVLFSWTKNAQSC